MEVQGWIRKHRTAVVALSGAAPLVLCAALAAARGSTPNASAVLGLVVLVVVAAAPGIRSAGLLAALSSALWFDVFLTEPYGRLVITAPADIEAAFLLLIVGGAVTELALWGQRQGAALAQQRGYLNGVLDAAEATSLGNDSGEHITDMVCVRIHDLLGADSCYFVGARALDPSLPTLEPDGSLRREGRCLNVERDGLPVDCAVALPVRGVAKTYGSFIVVAASHIARPTLEQRRIAVLLADQTSGIVDADRSAA